MIFDEFGYDILHELKIGGVEQNDDDNDDFSISDDEVKNDDSTDKDKNQESEDNTDNESEDKEQTSQQSEEDSDEEDKEDKFEVEDSETNNDDDSTENDDNKEDNFAPDYDEDGENESEEEDDTSNETDDNNDTESSSSKILDIEKDIYNSLTPEQQNIKNIELKARFVDIYNGIDKVLTRINDLQNVDTTVLKILDRITNTLTELKTYIEDTLSNSYDTRGYIENLVVYQKYFTIFNAAGKVLEKINISIEKITVNDEDS